MQTTRERAVVRELMIEAAPETVWGFLVDPDKALRWMGVAIRVSDRAGDEFRCEVIPGHIAVGEVKEVEPFRRLVLSWGWQPPTEGPAPLVGPGTSTVVFELEPTGTGTMLRFAHCDLPTEETVASHATGWDHYLPRLEVAAAGGDPGRDEWLDS
ncbi:MAG: SRPBCC domain-containing protein [Gaiellales bacterium]